MLKVIVIVGSLIALVLGTGVAANQVPLPTSLIAKQPEKSGQYLTSAVSLGHIKRSISVTGTLKAVSTVAVSSQLSGQIASLHADFNETVTAGQALAILDQRGFKARVQQAAAELQMAIETISVLTAKHDRAISSLDSEVARRDIFAAKRDQAQISLLTAENALKRTQSLASRGTSSRQSLENAKSSLESARTVLREAEAVAASHEHVIASSRAGEREAQAELANAKAAVHLKKASLALARLDLDRSTIRAPIDGVVIGRNIEKGQTVATSLEAPTMFTIAGDLSKMEIHASIDETDIGEIALGQTAEFTVDAYAGRGFSAKVREIRKAPRALEGVVVYTVILSVPNARKLLLPGMTATVRIAVNHVGPIHVLPLAALRFAPQGRATEVTTGEVEHTVWVLSDNRNPEPRNVQLGLDDGREVAVLGGELAIGDRVITGSVPPKHTRRWFGIQF